MEVEVAAAPLLKRAEDKQRPALEMSAVSSAGEIVLVTQPLFKAGQRGVVQEMQRMAVTHQMPSLVQWAPAVLPVVVTEDYVVTLYPNKTEKRSAAEEEIVFRVAAAAGMDTEEKCGSPTQPPPALPTRKNAPPCFL